MNPVFSIAQKYWQLPSREKVGVVCVLMLALIKFVVVPLWQNHSETLAAIESLQILVDKKQSLLDRRQELDAELDRNTAAARQAENMFFVSSGDAQSIQLKLQQVLEDMMDALSIEKRSITWLSAFEGALAQAPVRIKCKAQGTAILKLVEKIENNRYFIGISRLKIIRNLKNEEISAEFDVSAYGLLEKNIPDYSSEAKE